MLKLVTLVIVVGGLVLTGCGNPMDPQDGIETRQQEVERTTRPVTQHPTTFSDSTVQRPKVIKDHER